MHEHVNNAFVCLMGMGVVFVGLIVIVLICYVLGFLCRVKTAPAGVHGGAVGIIGGADGPTAIFTSPAAELSASTGAAPEPQEELPDRQQVIAAVSAAIAEELGTDVTGIRVLSFKKI